MKHEFKYKNVFRYQLIYIILIVLFVVAVILNVNTGSVNITPVQIFKIIFLKQEQQMSAYNIIWKIRLPRLLTAAVLGGALSLSGYLLQAFFRNPIAGPFVLVMPVLKFLVDMQYLYAQIPLRPVQTLLRCQARVLLCSPPDLLTALLSCRDS